jgi:hypothetical protein
MGIFKIYSLSKNNEKRYISNTSPLLWTDDKNKAKIFRSEGEIESDLVEHTNSLEKMINNLELVLVTERIE